MNRQLNLRFFLLLCAMSGLLVAALFGIRSLQLRRGSDQLLEQADEAEARGEVDGATEALQQYIAIHPDNAAVIGRLAALLSSDERATTPAARNLALRTLDRALQLDPNQAELRWKAAEFAMGLSRYDVARTHLELLNSQKPSDPEVEEWLGYCDELLKNYKPASEWYALATSHDRTRVQPFVRRAYLLRTQLGDPAAADRLMDLPEPREGLIASNPQSAEAYLARAEYRRQLLDDQPGYDADVARAAELDTEDPDVMMARVASSQTANRIDEARKLVDRALVLHPDDARFYRAGAALDAQAGKVEEAIDTLDRGLARLTPSDTNTKFDRVDPKAPAKRQSTNSDAKVEKSTPKSARKPVTPGMPDERTRLVMARLNLKFALAELLVAGDEGQRARGRSLLEELKKTNLRPELIDYQKARLDAAEGLWADAASKLEALHNQLGANPEQAELDREASLLLAQCYSRLGDVDRTYDAYRAADAAGRPDSSQAINARLGLGATLAELGRLDEAIDAYHKALAMPGVPDRARLELARLLIFKNLTLPTPDRNWAEAEQLIGAAETAAPEDPDATLARAQLLVVQDRLDPARELLQKAVERNPDQLSLWTSLATLTARLQGLEAALAVLESARGKVGEEPDLTITRIQLYQDYGGAGTAVALAGLEREALAASPESRRRSLAALVEAYSRTGDVASARRLTDRLVTELPQNLALRVAQLDLAFRAGDLSAVAGVVAKLKELEGENGLRWRYGQARMLIEQAAAKPIDQRASLLREARGLLATLAVRRPNWPSLALSEAQIDDLLGNTELALRNYRRAIDLGDRNPGTFQRAVTLLMARQQYRQADQVMRKLQDPTLLSPELQRLAASVAIESRDDQRALDLARRAVPATSQKPEDAIWLGWIYRTAALRAEEAGKAEQAGANRREAEGAFRKAVALGPDRPEGWLALVSYLAETKQADAARKAIEEAGRSLKPADAPLTLAQCYATLGETKPAEEGFRKVLETRPDDPAAVNALASFYLYQGRFGEAEPLLRKLIDLQATSRPEEASWARRVLAQLLALQGKTRTTTEALELLGLGADRGSSAGPAGDPELGGLNDADLRAQAAVLALQPRRDQRRRAIRVIEELIHRETAQPQDQLLLARLLDADRNWPGARARFQLLVDSLNGRPEQRDFIAEFARALLQHGETREAQRLVEAIEKLAPQAPGTIELKARLLVAQGQKEQAESLLSSFAQGRDNQLGAVAALLEELGLPAAAEPLYRRFAELPEQPPEKVLVLAAFLARHGRLPEALDIAEKAWDTCPLERAANRTVALLFATPPKTEDFARVEKRLQEAITKNPDTLSLQYDLANLFTLEGRQSEAEEIYRRIYAKDPDNPNSLNNLAWVIAASGGNAAQAIELINRAIGSFGEVPNLRDTRAIVYIAQGKANEAITELEEVVAIERRPIYYMHLAQAHEAAGHSREATDAFRQALSLGLKADSLHPLERKTYDRLERLANRTQ